MSIHVMVDLETLSTAPTAAFATLAAIAFDPEGDGLPLLADMKESTEKFYMRVSLDSCLYHGLRVDGSTIAWWLRQDPAAQRETAAACEGGVDLASALWSFKEWYKLVRPIRVWANGSCFDIPILDNAYIAIRSHSPWQYQGVRDMRTRMEDAGMKYTSPEVLRHNALIDAYHQALAIQESTRRLKEGKGA